MELITLAGYSACTRNSIVYDKGEEVVVYPVGKTLVVRQGIDESSSQILLKGHTDSVTCLALSRCGKYLVSGQSGIDSDVCLWDMKETKLLHRWSEHDFGVNAVGFSADSLFAFTVGCPTDGQLIVWEVTTGKIVARTQLPIIAKNTTPGSTASVTYLVTGGAMGGRIRTSKGIRLAEYPISLCSPEGALLWVYSPNEGKVEPYGDTKSGILPSSLSKREVTAACFSPGFSQSYLNVTYNNRAQCGRQVPDQSPSFLICGTLAGELMIYDIRGLGKAEWRAASAGTGVCVMPSSSVTLRGVFSISHFPIESLCEYEAATLQNPSTTSTANAEPRRRVYRTLEGLSSLSGQEQTEHPSVLLTTKDGCLVLVTPAVLINSSGTSEVTKSVGLGAVEPEGGAEIIFQSPSGCPINAIACSPRSKTSVVGDGFRVVSSVILGFTNGEIGGLDVIKNVDSKDRSIKTIYSTLHTGPGLPIECIQPLTLVSPDKVPTGEDTTEGMFVCSEGTTMRMFDAYSDSTTMGISWMASGDIGHQIHSICCVNTEADGNSPENATPVFLGGSLDGYLVNIEMVDECDDDADAEGLQEECDIMPLNLLWEIADGDRRGVTTILYHNNTTMIPRAKGLITTGAISSRLPGNLCKYNSAGPTLIVGGTTGDIRIWDIRTRKLITTVKEHKKNIISMVKIGLLDINDYLLLVASGDDVITLFRVIGGDKVVRVSDIFSKSTVRGLSGVVFDGMDQNAFALSISTDARVHGYKIGRVGQPLLEEIQTVLVDRNRDLVGAASLPNIPTGLFSDGGMNLLCPLSDQTVCLIQVAGIVKVPGGEALGIEILGCFAAHSAPIISGAIHGHFATTCDSDGMMALWKVM